jgi:predicted O-methyltransferase YrrM
VLFVDADHRLAGVAGDLQLYAPLVRPGGLVAMHDVGWPFGCDAVAHAPFDVGTLQTLADVRAAFSSLALGRRSETVTYEWGIGGIWM